MARAKQSVAAIVMDYFRSAPLGEARQLLELAQAEVKRRGPETRPVNVQGEKKGKKGPVAPPSPPVQPSSTTSEPGA